MKIRVQNATLSIHFEHNPSRTYPCRGQNKFSLAQTFDICRNAGAEHSYQNILISIRERKILEIFEPLEIALFNIIIAVAIIIQRARRRRLI